MDRHPAVIDLGGTWVRGALVGHAPELLGRVEERTYHEHGPAGVIHQISHVVGKSIADAGVMQECVDHLVIATPGPANARTGMVFSPPNMIGWGTVPLQSLLEDALGMRVSIVNDANAAALGEFHYGAGKGARNLVYITVSTGVGAGVVIEGTLLEGTSGLAGELGHTTIDRHGPICRCGNVGCLEAIASGTSIARRYREAVPGSEAINAEDVERASEEGDRVAGEILEDAMEAIGIGVVNSIQLFNPDVVILGGGVTHLGPVLFQTVRRLVKERAFPVARADVRVVGPALGGDAGLAGAAAIAGV